MAALLLLTGCGNNPSPSGRISANLSTYDKDAIGQVLDMQKISRDDALGSIDVLQKAFKNSYIGYDLKQSLNGNSSDKAFADCRKIAEAGPEKLTSVEVYDYILQCLAGLNDTHIGLTRLNKPVFITTAVSDSRMVGGRLYITGIRPALIKKFEEMLKLPADSLKEKLKTGTEITAINGQPIDRVINDLKKYVSASSERYRTFAAVDEMFTRNFNFPNDKTISLSLKTKDGNSHEVELPWVLYTYSGGTGSIESRALMLKKGFPSSYELDEDEEFMDSENIGLSGPLFETLSGKRKFISETGSSVMVTGIATVGGKNHCYLQLNTFSIPSDKEYTFKVFEKIGDNKLPQSFDLEVKNFLKSCEAFQAPLIFDLRNNGGGNAAIGHLIYGFLESADAPALYDADSYLMKTGNFTLLNKAFNGVDQNKTSLEQILSFNSVQSALGNNQTISDWAAYRTLGAERAIFKGKISVLTSENCISACDIMANRFKISGRGKIFGTPTNGTGFGYSSMGSTTTEYYDFLKLYTIKVPNFAFQNIVVADDKNYQADEAMKGSVIRLSNLKYLENNPTVPDAVIEYTSNDLTGPFPDYISSLEKLLAD
jgi:C-terminal processing protease CtpA/Prc